MKRFLVKFWFINFSEHKINDSITVYALDERSAKFKAVKDLKDYDVFISLKNITYVEEQIFRPVS